ncbi:MAG: FAD-binding oxidoreductase [Acidimicrobiales bacterium]
MTAIEQADIEALAADFLGVLIQPGDPTFDSARQVWNGHIQRQPALIARCRGVADVMAAVRFGRQHDLLTSVRGGGHSVAGLAVADGGLVIDLSAMTGTRVDPIARTIRCEGGCHNAHLDRESQAFGLAATGGFVSHTGIGGLTLGGGIGHLMRAFGLSIDALRSCDVVTADGELVIASADVNPDLFWGLRGGGGNFGVVTSFEFDLQPLGPMILAGLIAWPLDQARTVLAGMRDFLADAPDEVGVLGNVRLAPAMPFIPEELHGKPIVAMVLTYAGSIEDGESALRPLRELGTPAFDGVMPKLYTAHQKMFDPGVPHGNHYYWKSHRLGPLTDDVIDIIVRNGEAITSPLSTVGIFSFGGAMARVPEDATAFPHRDASHDINIVGSWLPDDDGDRHIAWVRGFFADLEPHSRGVYVNFTSDDAAERVHAAYSDDQWTRLTKLKSQYDPTNFFRLNANIPPA